MHVRKRVNTTRHADKAWRVPLPSPRHAGCHVGKRTNSAGESRRCHRRGTKMSSMALIPTGQHRRSSSALTENTCMLCSRHTIGARCSAGPFDNELVDSRRLTARVVVSASIGRFKQPQGWPRPCTGTDPVHEACKCRCHNMVYASDQSRKPRCMRTVHCSKNRRTHTAQHNNGSAQGCICGSKQYLGSVPRDHGEHLIKRLRLQHSAISQRC